MYIGLTCDTESAKGLYNPDIDLALYDRNSFDFLKQQTILYPEGKNSTSMTFVMINSILVRKRDWISFLTDKTHSSLKWLTFSSFMI